MKKFKKVMAMSCAAIMAVSAMSVSAFAKNNDDISVETYANMNIDVADETTRAKILEARREIIYSTDWVADGYTAQVENILTGEVVKELPQFSEVFPNWELPVEDNVNKNNDNKAFDKDEKEEVKVMPLSASSWINIGTASVYINSATSSTASPFATVYADPYEVGDKLRAYATSLTSSETCNIGFSNASTNTSLASATYLSPYEACVVSGVAEKNVSVRTSTYSSPGWGNFSVDGANRWVIVR